MRFVDPLFVMGAIYLALLATALPGKPQAQPRNWTEEKCVRYQKAWVELIRRSGKEGLSPEFIERHNAFIDSGCSVAANVCPRSPRELDVANVLTIQAMNAGMASTFLPFACRR
jgi:hypothetical protein